MEEFETSKKFEVFGEKSERLFEETIEFWSKRFERDVTQEEAREMIQNISKFVSLLAEWNTSELSCFNTAAK